MKLFVLASASTVANGYKWEAPTSPHGGKNAHGASDLILQNWQVQGFLDRGYNLEDLTIDPETPHANPNKGRGLVDWASLFRVTASDGRIIIPYYIDSTVPSSYHNLIHTELEDFSLAINCVKFVSDQSKSNSEGVHIFGESSVGSGCWSYVGRCGGCGGSDYPSIGSWQALRLPNWCLDVGGIHHEFLHAVGFLHEQDRPDFSNYFTGTGGTIDPNDWINSGHPLEPNSNVMYSGFNLINGKSYQPHPLLTTTDAQQTYHLYCQAVSNTFPMEPTSRCLEPDMVDHMRPVFVHKLCDGFQDCYDGEDEDGRLCSGSTLRPCADHNCGPSYRCVNLSDMSGFTCDCRIPGTCDGGPTTTTSVTTTTAPPCNVGAPYTGAVEHVDIPETNDNPHGKDGHGVSDLVLQNWQVPGFLERGYKLEDLRVDPDTPTENPNTGRGLVNWANLFRETDPADGRIIIPYYIDSTVTNSYHERIHSELADFSLAISCVKFVHDPSKTKSEGVHIFGETSVGSGCWSYVGRCSGCGGGDYPSIGTWQALRLPDWCAGSGGIHHEFLHAVGFLHEQDRPDFYDHFTGTGGDISPGDWIDSGHPLEPNSNVMYSGFSLINGRSYTPHPLLTTTDALQTYHLYCQAVSNTFPMEPISECLENDVVDVIRPVFMDKFCDGFKDCLNGEDEDGRLATCGAGETTARGCCKVLTMGFGGAVCTASGSVNCKDRYLCDGGWGAELRWEPDYGWFHSVDVGGWSYYANGDKNIDFTCLGDGGEFTTTYPWNYYDLELSCKPGDGPATPTPCANHDCTAEYRCVNDSDLSGYTCECRTSSCGTTTTKTTTTKTTTTITTTTHAPCPGVCDPDCDEGERCVDGTCEDVNECSNGMHNCHSYEKCRNINGGWVCEPGNDSCGSEKATWKGRISTSYVYKGDDSVMLSTKFKVKKSPVNVRTELYRGFIVWTKNVCGNDFLKKMRSGEVGVHLVDTENVYAMGDTYFKNDGKYTMGGFTFTTTKIVTKDTPWAFKGGVPTKVMSSDNVQIILTGLKNVQWLDAKGRDWCLLTAANGLMANLDYPENLTQCIFEGKKFWQAPGDPNSAK